MRHTLTVRSTIGRVQPVYLLVDASGSTQRSGLNSACNQTLPEVIDALERAACADFYLSLLTFGSEATTALSLSPLGHIQLLPQVPASGFSSIASGLRLLGAAVSQDYEQMHSDHLDPLPALAVVVTDGQPTDSADDIRLAYQDCCAYAGTLGELLVVVGDVEVASSVAGLGQGLAKPDVDVVELPVVDSAVLGTVIAGWLARSRVTAS